MKEYLIEYNSGDTLHDVIDTLNLYDKKYIDLLALDYCNGIDSIFLYKSDYDITLDVSDSERESIYKRGYRIDFSEILLAITDYDDSEKLLNKFYNRYVYSILVGKDQVDVKFINLCFDILSDENIFNKFIDFDNNKDMFSFNGSYNQEHYMLEMIRFFDENKNIVKLNNTYFPFGPIDETMYMRYYQLKKMITVSERTRQDEEVKIDVSIGDVYSYHKQRWMDNDWTLDKSIEDYVFDGMNQDYSTEEKIAYIYIKLCKLLEFEDSYLVDGNYDTLYSRQVMESISVSNPHVLCVDFCHIFTKLVNRFENVDARSVRRESDDRGHEYIALLIKDKNIRIDFEPTDGRHYDDFTPIKSGNYLVDTNLNDIKFRHFNDLSAVKIGTDLIGVDCINDSEGLFKNAIERIYRDFLFQNVVPIDALIYEYEKSFLTHVPIDYNDSFNKFLSEMKTRNISGSELSVIFLNMDRIGYFGNMNWSFMGRKLDDGSMERLIVFENYNQLYYFRTRTQEVFKITKEELNNLFNQGALFYDDEKYTLEGVGKSI